MTSKRLTIAIFGGAFDPLHLGHLKTASHIQSQFHFDQFHFLPCKIPLLKNPSKATTEQRLAMLELGLADYPEFNIDRREIQRKTPSYMVDTLRSFRQEQPDASLSLILGVDAFSKLEKWHQWNELINLCHFIIINRTNYDSATYSPALKTLLKEKLCSNTDELFKKKSGLIYTVNAGDYDISSSQIRANMDSTVKDKLPENVYHYIMKYKLYQ